MAEREVQAELMLAIGARPYLRLWRQNTGVAVYTGRDGGKRFVKFGVPGGADLSGLLACGRRLEVECKAPKGGPSREQRAFGEMITRMGGVYFVARSVADADLALANHLSSCSVCASATRWSSQA